MAARTALKISGLVVLAVVALVFLALAWLLGTTSGSRWALGRVGSFTGQPLDVAAIEGNIGGGLTLTDIRFGAEMAPVSAEIGRLFVDLELSALLGGTVHVRGLEVQGARVQLNPTQDTEPAAQEEPFSLEAPVDVRIDALSVREAVIRSSEATLLDVETFEFAGRWVDTRVVVERLELDAAQGQVTLNGELSGGGTYAADATGQFEWATGGRTLAGALEVTTGTELIDAEVALAQPLTARLELSMAREDLTRWSAQLSAPTFAPADLLEGSTLQSAMIDLQGSGTLQQGSVAGRIVVNGEPLDLVSLAFAREDERVDVDLQATVAESGELRAEGQVDLASDPFSASLSARWSMLALPAAWVGQRLDTEGRVGASGTVADWEAEGRLMIGPPGRLASLALNVNGSPGRLQFSQLDVQQTDGGLTASGSLELEPALSWNLTAEGTRFDPGAFFVAWPGSLDFRLDTAGERTAAGPSATLELHELAGELRGRPVMGEGEIALSPQTVVSGTLRVSSGESAAVFSGQPGASWDATLQVDVAVLDDWIPDATGRINGRFDVAGEWPSLQVNGNATAQGLRAAGVQVDRATLALDAGNVAEMLGTARVTFTGMEHPRAQVATGELVVSSSRDEHELAFSAQGDPVSFSLGITGRREERAGETTWIETVESLSVVPREAGRFVLEEPAVATLALPAVTLSELCLVRERERVCTAFDREATGDLAIEYRLADLSLALIEQVLPTIPVNIEGTLAGEGTVRRTSDGELFGEASLRSAGQLWQGSEDKLQSLLEYRDLSLVARFEGATAEATLGARLDESGVLDGRIAIDGLGRAVQPLTGSLTANLEDLNALSLLTPHIAAVGGQVQADATLAGTIANPVVSGGITASGLTANLPMLGITLRDGRFEVLPSTNDARMTLQGEVQSGDGALRLAGTAGYDGTLEMTIEGDQFLAADTPGARVVASPDLTLSRTEAEGIQLNGTVVLPAAMINVQRLPRSVRAPQGSPDIVIVDAEQTPEEEGSAIPLTATVEVILGDDVMLAGYGLDAELGGRLTVNEAPDAPTTGSGEIRVAGRYQAYGQDLTITQGSVVFADSPLANPALRISAVRTVEDVTAGIRITGTARRPELELFSDPSMDDASVLSYLVAGRPLSDIGEGDGDALQSAAQSLGTAAGGLLSRRLGQRLGVDTLAVEDSEVLDGAAFTVGQYLSPRLYLSYGVGLFEPGDVITLRYRLSDDLALRAIRGPEDSRAGIDYRREK